ncbi:MAG: hypothetical protein NZ903_02275 [Candidatus Micrarchaeota archaeon]|nr:hypothetical protein [Candidatus Micrarchaeota archaeon]
MSNLGMKLISTLEGISFGLVDGSICAIGAVVGVATATNDKFITLLAVLIFALSDSLGNAAGFYLSQLSERNVQLMRKRKGRVQHVHTQREILLNGIFTFVSTFLIYCLIALPLIFIQADYALITSVFIALMITFGLGFYVGGLVGENRIKSGITYSAITVLTAILSYLFGTFLNNFI